MLQAFIRRIGYEKLLMEPLAIRLGEQTTLAKSLVMSGHPDEAFVQLLLQMGAHNLQAITTLVVTAYGVMSCLA